MNQVLEASATDQKYRGFEIREPGNGYVQIWKNGTIYQALSSGTAADGRKWVDENYPDSPAHVEAHTPQPEPDAPQAPRPGGEPEPLPPADDDDGPVDPETK